MNASGSKQYGIIPNTGHKNTFGDVITNRNTTSGTTVNIVPPLGPPASTIPSGSPRLDPYGSAQASRGTSESRDELTALTHDRDKVFDDQHGVSSQSTHDVPGVTHKGSQTSIGENQAGPPLRRGTGSRIIEGFHSVKRRLTHHSQGAIRNVADKTESRWNFCGMPIFKHTKKRFPRSESQPSVGGNDAQHRDV